MPSQVYGGEHLLRLLTKLPTLLVKTDLSPNELSMLQTKLGDFLKHLAKYKDTIFLDHYQLREAHLGPYGLGSEGLIDADASTKK